jgi:Ni,Fe-hydrogenase III large subunit
VTMPENVPDTPSTLANLVADGRAAPCRPWPRSVVPRKTWLRAADHLEAGDLTLLSLWGEPDLVHMAVADARGDVAVLSHAPSAGRFPSIARRHVPAARFERAVRDLHGLVPDGASDRRPWLDHGRWEIASPLGDATPRRGEGPYDYRFLPAEGEALHEIPVGPVHAGIIEPGHFRFTASGETVVRLEERLGYVHRGVEGLMAGADLDKAARIAGRVSGDSTVAYALAFARAVEAALGIEAPPRAVFLRAVMAELERIANHLGDIGAVANDAAFSLLHAHCQVLRERVVRAADACFGHRLMMDRVVPGGVAADLSAEGANLLRETIAHLGRRFPHLVTLYEGTASLQDRTVGTGTVSPALVRRFGAGGYVGRAAGRREDVRLTPGYPPYDALPPTLALRTDGDVNARVWVRIDEVLESVRLIGALLDGMPDGPVLARVDRADDAPGEGMARVEGFRGDVFAWVRMQDDGRVDRAHLRDPSWLQWPLLEAAIEGNIVADFPLCNKSFNGSYAGHDL